MDPFHLQYQALWGCGFDLRYFCKRQQKPSIESAGKAECWGREYMILLLKRIEMSGNPREEGLFWLDQILQLYAKWRRKRYIGHIQLDRLLTRIWRKQLYCTTDLCDKIDLLYRTKIALALSPIHDELKRMPSNHRNGILHRPYPRPPPLCGSCHTRRHSRLCHLLQKT